MNKNGFMSSMKECYSEGQGYSLFYDISNGCSFSSDPLYEGSVISAEGEYESEEQQCKEIDLDSSCIDIVTVSYYHFESEVYNNYSMFISNIEFVT